jgi:hypothetical protein
LACLLTTNLLLLFFTENTTQVKTTSMTHACKLGERRKRGILLINISDLEKGRKIERERAFITHM